MRTRIIPAPVLLLVALLCGSGRGEDGLSVHVEEGPKMCVEAEKVKVFDHVSVHYVGKIDESSATGIKGHEFDSSARHGSVLKLQMGMGLVIQGWDQGLLGLCKGAKARLIVPPALGYGDQGGGPRTGIPGGATLNFLVEVVEVHTPDVLSPEAQARAKLIRPPPPPPRASPPPPPPSSPWAEEAAKSFACVADEGQVMGSKARTWHPRSHPRR